MVGLRGPHVDIFPYNNMIVSIRASSIPRDGGNRLTSHAARRHAVLQSSTIIIVGLWNERSK